jgi:serine/threonine protein kinase
MGLVDGDNHLSLAELKKQTVHFDVGDQLKLGELRTMGGYSNVHDGEIVREDGTLKVAVKCFREPGAGKDIEKVRTHVTASGLIRSDLYVCIQAILRELFIWSRTQHENILPLIGFATPTGYKQPVLISQWMENGTVTDYMENRPVAELKDVVRISLTAEFAYLKPKTPSG